MKDKVMAIVRLVCVLIAAAAAFFGWALDANLVYFIVDACVTLGCVLWAWWKNNNLSEAAGYAEAFLLRLKGGQDKDEAEQEVIDDLDTADDTKVNGEDELDEGTGDGATGEEGEPEDEN